MNTISDLKKMSAAELDKELGSAKKDLFKMKFEVNNGASKASHKVRELKKYVAQIKTIKNELVMADKANFEKQKVIKTKKS